MDFTLADDDDAIFGSSATSAQAMQSAKSAQSVQSVQPVQPVQSEAESTEMEIEEADDQTVLFVSYRDGSIVCMKWPEFTPLYAYPQMYMGNSVLKPLESGYQQGRSKYCMDIQMMRVGPVSIKEMQCIVLVVGVLSLCHCSASWMMVRYSSISNSATSRVLSVGSVLAYLSSCTISSLLSSQSRMRVDMLVCFYLHNLISLSPQFVAV